MNLTILGSGTMMPTKKRNPSAFLLEAEGKRILLDCGHSTIRRLVDFGINPQSVDVVFISHFHCDHFGDAFNLVHSRLLKPRKIFFIGPKDLQKRFVLWRTIFWPEANETYPLEFKEGERKLNIGNIDIEIFPVYHVPWFQSVGVKITHRGKTIVYTGDIGSDHPFEHLVEISRDADLLLIEAAAPKPSPNHFTIEQVKELVKQAKVKQTLIVHIRQDMNDLLKRSIRNVSNIILAKDGLKVSI